LIFFFFSLSHQQELQTLSTLTWQTPTTAQNYDFIGKLVFCSRGNLLFGYRDGSVPNSPCTSPGPTIRMKPGSRYLLSLQNTGGATTNLHTHGLHISGDGPVDNVFRSLSATTTSNCLFYSFNIPSDHNSGTFWYHAHLHMSTEDQVSGGAVGMVIIEDKRADNSYSDIPSSATTNNPNLATFLSTEKLLFFSEIYTDIATIRTRYVNGVGPLSSSNIPQITLVANQWYRFRVASSKPSGTNSVFTFPGACTVRQLARDGIFLSTVPATQSTLYNIAGPSRIELAVRCTVTSSTPVYITWDNTYKVQVISNTGTPNLGSPFMPDGLSQWKPVRPSYLQDMSNVAVQSSFSMQASPSTMSFNGATGVQFSTTTPITTLTYNRVYEMRVITNNNHPIHLHVYPMQIIGVWSTNTNSVTPGDCGNYKQGEFYDSIMDSRICVVRFRTIDFGGKVVLHCHLLRHEDAGAMAWISVTGGGATIPSTPSTTAVPCTTFQ